MVALNDFLTLHSYQDFIHNITGDTPDIDTLDLWHRRTADTSHNSIREAVRNKLIEGVVLDRKHFTTKGRKGYKCPCDVCARAKMHRISFPSVRDRLVGLSPGDYMSADILIMNNIPSREGYKYVFFVVDHSSKTCWGYPMERRDAETVLKHLKELIEVELPSRGIRMKHFHSDGGGELIATACITYLHTSGATTSHSPRDTPEMNSVTERWVRSLKEKVMCMLLRSSLPIAFWWNAVDTAIYLLNRLPTKTARGYMTPIECITNNAPNLKFLRIWGCKCYALKPIAERLKDFDDKAYSGFLVGYCQENTGYMVFVPSLDTIVESVHVIFNEVIPDPTAEYFQELEHFKIEVASKAESIEDYDYLVGLEHEDDEDDLMYVTTRVVIYKGIYIVAYRRLVTNSTNQPREEKTPIHIADIVRMTAATQLIPSGSSASVSRSTTSDEQPVVPPAGTSVNPSRVVEAPNRTPSSATTHQQPSWNSQGRLATATPPAKRVRFNIEGISQRPLQVNLEEEFIPATRRSNRLTNNTDNHVNYIYLLQTQNMCPRSYRQAIESPEVEKWKLSMKDELYVLAEKRKCWTIVPYPAQDQNILRCHFVYKIKSVKGIVDRYKSRLVVDGSKQIEGIDYNETFAPVVKYTTLRLFLAICAVHKMKIHQLDVENAFIYAPLQEDVYMHPHPEMGVPKGKCVKLNLSLYGLKQSPRNWNQMLHNFVLSIGFIQCGLDYSFYFGHVEGAPVLLAVYVDDILIASGRLSSIIHIKTSFKNRFNVKDMGEAEEFLGVRLKQESDSITMDQTLYTIDLLEKFSEYIGDRNYSDVPTETEYMPRMRPESNHHTSKQQEFVDSFPYPQIVGSLLYLSVVSRLDISYKVGVLTRHLKNPSYAACKAACRVLNYLSNNRSKGIVYRGDKLNLHGYTDSDWGGDKDTRRSTSGFIVIMAGGPVVWMSKLQVIVAVSSMEAEYIACFYLIQEIIWIRQFLKDLQLQRSKATKVFIDNKSARDLALNPVYHQRSKHIDIKYHWIRDQVTVNEVDIEHIYTEQQTADFLTKHVEGVVFHRHVDGIMVDVEQE
jgi:hypothetical protein